MSQAASCENCLYFDYDDEMGMEVCCVNLDQDEMANFRGMRTKGCPYYRFYDEYKSVRKQI